MKFLQRALRPILFRLAYRAASDTDDWLCAADRIHRGAWK